MRKVTYCTIGHITYFDTGQHYHYVLATDYVQRLREQGCLVVPNENVI